MRAEIRKIEKSKVAIVNGQGDILTLIRSGLEDSRPGEADWAGGKFDPKETDPYEVLLREVGEELPGTELQNVRPLYAQGRVKAGDFVMTYLFAATAEFPPEGIVLSHEHESSLWTPRAEFPNLDIPGKYKAAVSLGRPVLDEVAALTPLAEDQLRPAA